MTPRREWKSILKHTKCAPTAACLHVNPRKYWLLLNAIFCIEDELPCAALRFIAPWDTGRKKKLSAPSPSILTRVIDGAFVLRQTEARTSCLICRRQLPWPTATDSNWMTEPGSVSLVPPSRWWKYGTK